MQYRPVVATKRPATVEAWQWDGSKECADLIVDWIVGANIDQVGRPRNYQDAHLRPNENVIVLGDGYESVKPGQVVIRDQFNDFWPLPKDIYDTVYSSPI